MGAPGPKTVRDDDDVTASIRSVVATLVAGQGVDPRADLEQLGAGFVVLRSADTAAQLTASRMDAVPGLVAVGQTDVGWLWRITPAEPARAAAGRRCPPRADRRRRRGHGCDWCPPSYDDVDTTIPEGPEGRLWCSPNGPIRGWSAWFDGRKLTATTSGWAQAFTLPPRPAS